jgi:hypothetical protein
LNSLKLSWHTAKVLSRWSKAYDKAFQIIQVNAVLKFIAPKMSIALFVVRLKRDNIFPTRVRQWQGLRFVSSQALVVLESLMCSASDIYTWQTQILKNDHLTKFCTLYYVYLPTNKFKTKRESWCQQQVY